MGKYYLNRISNEWKVQKALLLGNGSNQHYVSIGWLKYQDSSVLDIARESSELFSEYMEACGEKSRSRWNIWYFAQYKAKDTIIVPLFEKNFAICTILEEAKPISELAGMTFKDEDGRQVVITEKGAIVDGEVVDIGFVAKVRLERDSIKRSYAKPKLISRMKIRSSVADVSDLEREIKEAKKAKAPFNFSDEIVDTLAEKLNEELHEKITDTGLEQLVKWYMGRMGADFVEIPAKNAPDKEDFADADVVAVFEDLKTVYYIQVKNHIDKTDEWAVEQIRKYKEQKEDSNNDYTYISWVITTADFTDKAVEDAKAGNVRLIDGEAFSKMLINVGLYSIEDVKNSYE